MSQERVDVAQFGPAAGGRIGAGRASQFQYERESGRHDPFALTNLMDLAMNARGPSCSASAIEAAVVLFSLDDGAAGAWRSI
jgi:hypothetical protein